MPSTPQANGRVEKGKKQSRVITLSLQPSLLERFAPKKDTPSSASSPTKVDEDMPPLKAVSSQDNASESNSTPAPGQDAPTPGGTTGLVKKKGPGAGIKRGPSLTVDGLPKPRGKPGPKKKPRLEDGTIDHSASKPVTTSAANHKLGPKANTGNINANLRALDRSGAPCRKWSRKPFHLKSFTGVVWDLSSWKGSDKSLSNGTDVNMQDSSDMKPSDSDTTPGSNAGGPQDSMDISTPAAASSPAPFQHPPSITIQS